MPASDHFTAKASARPGTTGSLLMPELEILSLREISRLPAPRYLIEGLVIENGLGIIYGRPGCGKTFIALDIALSVACGRPRWWGRGIKKSGPVVFISPEGTSDLKYRIGSWESVHGVIEETTPFYLIRQGLNLLSSSDLSKLLRALSALAEKDGADPALILLDTISRVIPGSDENLQRDMTSFIKACDVLRETFGATVIGVHHTSRGGNLRGSTVFDGAADFLIAVEREDGAKTGQIVAKKIKSAEDGWRQDFELKPVPSGSMLGSDSLVSLPVSATQAANPSMDPKTRLEILEQIDRGVINEDGSPTGAPLSRHPRAKSRWAGHVIIEQLGCEKPQAMEVLSNLIAEGGLLEVEFNDGHQKRPVLRANPDALMKLRDQNAAVDSSPDDLTA